MQKIPHLTFLSYLLFLSPAISGQLLTQPAAASSSLFWFGGYPPTEVESIMPCNTTGVKSELYTTHLINPRRGCARGVITVVVCVRVCFLCSAFSRFLEPNERYQRLQRKKFSKIKKAFSLKLLSSKVRSVLNLPRVRATESAIFFTCNVSVYLSVTCT